MTRIQSLAMREQNMTRCYQNYCHGKSERLLLPQSKEIIKHIFTCVRDQFCSQSAIASCNSKRLCETALIRQSCRKVKKVLKKLKQSINWRQVNITKDFLEAGSTLQVTPLEIEEAFFHDSKGPMFTFTKSKTFALLSELPALKQAVQFIQRPVARKVKKFASLTKYAL